MSEINPRRNIAARILFLFATLLCGSALLSQHWENQRSKREWSDYPTSLGDPIFFNPSATSATAQINGKTVHLVVAKPLMQLNDRFVRRIGWLSNGGSLYTEWTSLQKPQKSPEPPTATVWLVKTANHQYRIAKSQDH